MGKQAQKVPSQSHQSQASNSCLSNSRTLPGTQESATLGSDSGMNGKPLTVRSVWSHSGSRQLHEGFSYAPGFPDGGSKAQRWSNNFPKDTATKQQGGGLLTLCLSLQAMGQEAPILKGLLKCYHTPIKPQEPIWTCVPVGTCICKGLPRGRPAQSLALPWWNSRWVLLGGLGHGTWR